MIVSLYLNIGFLDYKIKKRKAFKLHVLAYLH